MTGLAGVGTSEAAPAKVETPVAVVPPQGNVPAPNGGGGEGSAASPAASSPNPVITPENSEFAKAKGWLDKDGGVDHNATFKAYQSLEQHLGKTVVVPDDKATQEERDAFARRLGWSDKADDYGFKAPADLPANLPYNSELADAFKTWAIEDRVPVATATKMHDRFVKFQVAALDADVKAYAQQVEDSAKAADAVVVKEWGEKGSEPYTKNTEAAKRALTDPKLSGLKDLLTAKGLLTPKGEFASFEIAHLLAAHGQQFMNGTFIAPGSGGSEAGNVFQKTLSDGSPNPAFNATMQGRIITQNPNEARRLIQQAGGDPAEYQL